MIMQDLGSSFVSVKSSSAVYVNEVLVDLPTTSTSSKFGLLISECRDLEAVEG